MVRVTALIDRVGAGVDAIDVFCGFGGSSQGIHRAGATVRAAANHNQLAIECHAANFPDTDHWRSDLIDPDSGDYLDPADLPRARFAWFSPGCTHHSQANAAKQYAQGRQASLFGDDDFDEVAYAKSERSRVTMSCVLRYCDRNRPEIVVVENVVEVCHWGPGRDGSTFQWWVRELELLGYDHEELFLNSGFFPPCPQSRDRIYIVAWRRGNRKPDLDYRPTAYCVSDRCAGKIVDAVQAWKPRKPSWPLPRWGKYGAQYIYACPDCNAEVVPVQWPAYSAINWENLGPRICDRESLGMAPLAQSTLDRNRRALGKFRNGPPVIVPCKAIWGSDRSVVEPFVTQTTQQDKALLVQGSTMARRTHATEGALFDQWPPAMAGNNSLGVALNGVTMPVHGNDYERPGQTRARSVVDPMFTLAASQQFGFAQMPSLVEMRGGGSITSGQHAVTDPAHTVTAGGFHHGLVSPALFSKINGGPTDTAWHDVFGPLNTVTGRDTHGLLVLPWVEQFRSDPAAISEQLATVMTHARHALASIEAVPFDQITDEELGQVRFRMLDPDPELRRTMAFDDDYILLGNKTQMTSGLGNAVTPPVAGWVTGRCMASLRG